MQKARKIINFLIKNISLLIIVFSSIAFVFPKYFKWMTKYTAVFLAVAMFGMGMSIEKENLKSLLKNPKDILIGCLAQYTIMPLIAFLLVICLKLNKDLALGVILVGCCPGGTASNVITHIADGDLAMSVAMTVLSTLIAPIVTPLLVYMLAGKIVDVSILSMFKSVVNVILIPVLMGMTINKIFPKSTKKLSSVFPLISSAAIVLIISGIIAANSNKIIECGFLVLFVVIIHNLFGFLGGLLISKLFSMDYKKQTAVAIEVGMQNSGLAVSLATANFALNPLATLPGAIFSIWHNIAGSIFAIIRRKEQKNNVNKRLAV